MPIYEYICADCGTVFDSMRPMSQADAPIQCRACSGPNTSRKLSKFSAFSKGNGGSTKSVAGTGSGCSSCAGGTCSTCHH